MAYQREGEPQKLFGSMNFKLLSPRQSTNMSRTTQGGSVDDVDSNGKTPRMLAVGRKHSRLVKFLDTRDTAKTWDWRYKPFNNHCEANP